MVKTCAAAEIAQAHGGQAGGLGGDGLIEAQRLQDGPAIGADLDARADLGDLGGLFQHRDPCPVPGGGERRGQPADAAADDRDGLSRKHARPPNEKGAPGEGAPVPLRRAGGLSRRDGPFRDARGVPAPRGSWSRSAARRAA